MTTHHGKGPRPMAVNRLLGVGLGLLVWTLGACSHDWDAYDPRLGTGTTTSTAASSGESGASSTGAGGTGGSMGHGGAGGTGGGGGAGAPVPCGADGVAPLQDNFDD